MNILNQFWHSVPRCIRNSGWIESGPGALTDLSDLRACCISSTVKSLHGIKSTEAPCNFSLSPLFTYRVNSRFTVALRQFFTKCWAILLALMGTWGLLFFSPVSRRTALQAFRVEWVKSIACTVSIHLSCCCRVMFFLFGCGGMVFLCQVITFIVPPGDIYLSVASWYVLFVSFDDCRDKLAITIVYISLSGEFGSGSSDNNLQMSLVKSSQ